MYCSECAKEVSTNAVFCTGCGCSVARQGRSTPKTRWGTGAITGLVLSTIFLPLIGIIMGVLNLEEDTRKTQARALLAVGLVMGCLNVLVFVS